MTTVIFHDFPGLEISFLKFHDFPRFSRMRGNPVTNKGWGRKCITHAGQRPCCAVSLSGDTAQRDGAACRDLLHFLTMWPCSLTSDLVLIGERDIVMDYPCAKCQVWRFWFQPFWFYRADRQTDTQTESQMRMIAILTRLPSWVTTIECAFNLIVAAHYKKRLNHAYTFAHHVLLLVSRSTFAPMSTQEIGAELIDMTSVFVFALINIYNTVQHRGEKDGF